MNPLCQPVPTEPALKVVEYTTANGLRPDGRYGFYPPEGTSKEAAEEMVLQVLQNNFNIEQSWIDMETNEADLFVPGLCGEGWQLVRDLGSIEVLRVRQVTPTNYDYDVALTCESSIKD